MQTDTTETTTETVGTQEETFIDSESFIDKELVTMLTPEKEEAEDEQPTEEVEATEATEQPEKVETEEDEQPAESKGVQKRIDKLTWEREEAERKASALEDRVKKLESGEASKPASALEKVKEAVSHESLDKLDDDAQEIIDFAIDNPEGYVADDGKEYSAADLKAMRTNARATQKEVRSRRQDIDQRAAQDAEILKAYPSLADDSSAESKAIEQVFSMVPELRNRPDGKRLAISFYLGEVQLSKEPQQPAAKTAKIGTKKAAPVEKAPSLGTPEQKPALSNPKPDEGTSKEALEQIAAGNDDVLDRELLKMFT